MNSIILRTTAHIVTGLMLVFSAHLLLRGHNEPGGGFIAALIAVIAFALLMVAESPALVRSRLRCPPLAIAFSGIGLVLASGLPGLLQGSPYLTGVWWKAVLPLGTPLLFDVGVYLSVLGSVLAVLLRLEEVLG